LGQTQTRIKVEPEPETEDKKMKRNTHWKDENFSARFLNDLMTKKEEVEKAFRNLMEKQKEYQSLQSDYNCIEEGDHAEREISLQTHYSILERKTRELQKIEFLIRRVLKDKEFGICEECGDPIPAERLLIVPEAVRCVNCQKDLEKFDSKGRNAQRVLSPSKWNKELQWEAEGNFDDEGFCIIETDMDYVSFVNLEESDLADSSAGENGKGSPPDPIP
jgi:DnaK suppressor protein